MFSGELQRIPALHRNITDAQLEATQYLREQVAGLQLLKTTEKLLGHVSTYAKYSPTSAWLVKKAIFNSIFTNLPTIEREQRRYTKYDTVINDKRHLLLRVIFPQLHTVHFVTGFSVSLPWLRYLSTYLENVTY